MVVWTEIVFLMMFIYRSSAGLIGWCKHALHGVEYFLSFIDFISFISCAYAPKNSAESALCCRGDVSIHPCRPWFFLSLINLPLILCCSLTDPPLLGSFSNLMLRFRDEMQKGCCLITIKGLELETTRSNRKLFLLPVHYKYIYYNACCSMSCLLLTCFSEVLSEKAELLNKSKLVECTFH